VVLQANTEQQSLLSLRAGACCQTLPSIRYTGYYFMGASLKMEEGCPVASTECVWRIVFLQGGQEVLVEGCGEAGKGLKRC